MTSEKRQSSEVTKQAIYPVATGDIVFLWPNRIPSYEAADLDAWFDIMKRNVKRSVVADEDICDS